MLSCSFTADATQQSSELSLGLGFETAAPIAPLFSGHWLRDYVKGRGPGHLERFAATSPSESIARSSDRDGPLDGT